jgi:putative transposase
MPKGRQKRVRSPGVNRKQTVFGAFCYGPGLFYYHIQPRKTAWGARILVTKLVKRTRRTGRRIIVVMDQGNPHHAGSFKQYLADAKEHIEVFWLPHYSPELNLIERLWKHLKRSRMANVLLASFKRFTEHLTSTLADFASDPDFPLSVTTPNCQKINRKKLLVAS